MRVLGYGEDALTYWALSRHLPAVIGQPPLSDDSTENDNLLLIYKPSFGRAGGQGSAQFGEFDAIVATTRAVYLIESKWTGEPIINRQVILAGRQILRHQVFRWIRDRWLEEVPGNWEQFYNGNRNARDFAERFAGKPLVQPGRRVASNLQYVLQQLPGRSAPTKDVLLYFRLEGDIPPEGVANGPTFVVVPFLFHPVNPEHGGRIIDMQAR